MAPGPGLSDPAALARLAAERWLGPHTQYGWHNLSAQEKQSRYGLRATRALEERAAMSPDALTGMEANLRFGPKETMATRVFGRLTAWQNWIFQRPNAVGAKGALKVYGTGEKAGFDFTRV